VSRRSRVSQREPCSAGTAKSHRGTTSINTIGQTAR
jgi:hypothetical protein